MDDDYREVDFHKYCKTCKFEKTVESKCDKLRDWVERLLVYTELSEEEMKTIVKKEKDSAEVFGRFTGLLGIFNGHY